MTALGDGTAGRSLSLSRAQRLLFVGSCVHVVRAGRAAWRRRRRRASRSCKSSGVGLEMARRVELGGEEELLDLVADDDDDEGDVDDGEGDVREGVPNCLGSWASVFESEGRDLSTMAPPLDSTKKTTLALVIGYDGIEYRGLQMASRTDGTFRRTIESELELALFRAGAIAVTNFGNLKRIQWKRAGRTDAGVSAACTVVSGRFVLGDDGIDGFLARVTEYLPPAITLFGAEQVPKRFTARKGCGSRSYQFTLPTYLLARSALEAVTKELQATGITGAEVADLDAEKLYAAASLGEHRPTTEEVQRFREALAGFRGTHWFGNFAGMELAGDDPRGRRHIRQIVCSDPFDDGEGAQWVTVSIWGDSFLTHQIRKMLASAVKVAQGTLPVDFIPAALDCRVECVTPKLPPTGLMFLRAVFGNSDASKKVEACIVSAETSGRVDAWLQKLQRSAILEERRGRQHLRWLALTSLWRKEDRRLAAVTVQEHRLSLARRQARIQEKRAAAVQITYANARRVTPLWVGRHPNS